jgi:hypothetical protein
MATLTGHSGDDDPQQKVGHSPSQIRGSGGTHPAAVSRGRTTR